MKHTHVKNITEYADAAERAVVDIQRMAMMYRKNPNELARWDLQQLVGELYTKTCAMLSLGFVGAPVVRPVCRWDEEVGVDLFFRLRCGDHAGDVGPRDTGINLAGLVDERVERAGGCQKADVRHCGHRDTCHQI